jgi:hypothetical protein
MGSRLPAFGWGPRGLLLVLTGCGGELRIDPGKAVGPEAQDHQQQDDDGGSSGGSDDGQEGDDTAPPDDETPEDSGAPEAPDWTVYDVQQGLVPSGTRVELGPLVASAPAASFGFYLQDPAGGPHSGIWIYTGYLEGGWRPPVEGERVQITGTVGEYTTFTDSSQTQLVLESGDDLAFLERGDPPVPQRLELASAVDPVLAEPWEGVLVEIEDLTVADAEAGYGEFVVEGGLHVDDLLYAAEVADGDTFTSIIGVFGYGYGTHKLLPRFREDLRGWDSPCSTADRCMDEVVVGALVVTEIMADPSVGSDAANEWIELTNVSGDSIDLAGLTVEDASGNAGTLGSSVVVAAGGRVVLGAGTGGSWAYGFAADAFYGGVGLNNTGDHVVLSFTGEDGRVVLDQSPDTTSLGGGGVSVQLDPRYASVSANDALERWCVSTAAIGSSGDHGTPGDTNRTCP